MDRKPDSRVTAGQALEDRLDAATDEMRRRTTEWIAKTRRVAPSDDKLHAAIIGGIAGGILDELHDLAHGDAERMRATWSAFIDSYLAAGQEDREADKEVAAS